MPRKRKEEIDEPKNHVQKKRRLSGKQGKLAYMREMSLDLVLEIFSHLDPLDLLRMTRVNRELRKTLLAKSSAAVWRSARANAGIPNPIGTMSEPAFASLIFEAHCSFCFAPNVRNIHWLAQSRVCKKCLKVHFEFRHPFSEHRFHGIPSLLWKTIPQCWVKNTTWDGMKIEGLVTHYLNSAIEDLRKEYAAVPESQVTAWIEERVGTWDVTRQEIDHCIKWDEERSTNNTNVLEDARTQRLNAIVERLGWSSALTQSTQFRSHKLVNQAKPITDRTWKTLGPQLEDFKEQLQSQLQIEFAGARYECLRLILREAEHTISRNLVMPPHVDIALVEPFKSIIESPLERGIERTLFDNTIQAIPQAVLRWNQTRTQDILELLRARCSDATESDLSTCNSLFQCLSCIDACIYSFPDILTHQCRGPQSLDDHSHIIPAWYIAAHPFGLLPSSVMNVRLYTKGIDRTREVARLLDMDPSNTPISTMLSLNPLVECVSCGTPEERCFLRWTSMLAHDPHEFRLVPQEHVDTVKSLEASIFPNPRRAAGEAAQKLFMEKSVIKEGKTVVLFCAHCDYRERQVDDIKAHVIQSHDIANATDKDWECVNFAPLCYRGVTIKGDARRFVS